MSDYRFSGTERVTIELAGTFDPARLSVPAGIELDRDGDRARVSLFAFAVEDLRIRGVPFASWSYPEVLWRVAVLAGGVPSWWVIACDLAARGPRFAAARWVRYVVRPLAVELDAERISIQGAIGELAVQLTDPVGNAAVDVRPVVTGADAAWRVPWGDDGGEAHSVRAQIARDSLAEPTLGATVRWADTATLRRGRVHRCGVGVRR